MTDLPSWFYFACGIIPGVLIGIWLANDHLQKRIRYLKWQVAEEEKYKLFWRNRFADVLRTIEEQDVQQ